MRTPPSDPAVRTRQQNNVAHWVATAKYTSDASSSIETLVRIMLEFVREGDEQRLRIGFAESPIHRMIFDAMIATARAFAQDLVALEALRNAGQVLDAAELEHVTLLQHDLREAAPELAELAEAWSCADADGLEDER